MEELRSAEGSLTHLSLALHINKKELDQRLRQLLGGGGVALPAGFDTSLAVEGEDEDWLQWFAQAQVGTSLAAPGSARSAGRCLKRRTLLCCRG